VRTGGGGGSPPNRPSYEPPPVPASNGPHPNSGSRAAVETRRIVGPTDRTPLSNKQSPVHPVPVSQPDAMPKGLDRLLGTNPIVRIVLEALIIFGVALLVWWIVSKV
jgi:hypothetical protein